MYQAVTVSVPLLEPPDWAIAERALFDLLDRAWWQATHQQYRDNTVSRNWFNTGAMQVATGAPHNNVLIDNIQGPEHHRRLVS